MSLENPLSPDPSFSSGQPQAQALEKGALAEIQRELRALSARMERAENRLGLKSVVASAAATDVPTRQTSPVAPPPNAAQPAAPPPKVASPPIPPPLPPARPRSVWEPEPVPAGVFGANFSKALPATGGENLGSDAGSAKGSTPFGAMRDKLSGAAARKQLVGDWENLIGGKWALWAGLFSLFLAIASFLAYTWKSLPPIPPAGRFALGIAAGAALIGAGSFFRTRTQRWFSEGLAGAGLGVLYLSIWAGAQQYHLLSFNTAFAAMGLTTVLGVYLAVRFDALSLSVLAILGGFLTPLLLHGKSAPGSELLSGQSLSLLTYVAVLNAGILGVSLFKRWNSLTWLSFIATIVLIGAWAVDDYSAAQRWPAFAYFTIYFLLFVGASCFYSLARKEKTEQPDLLLLFAATSIYALAGHALLDGALKAVPSTFACVLALFFGLLYGAVKILGPENPTLRQSAGGLALLFLTVAVPIQFQRQGLVVGWCVEAGVLLILGLRLRAALLQRAGQIVWCLSLVPLLGILTEAAPKPPLLFLNERALPLLASLLATALVVFQNGAMAKQAMAKQASEASADSSPNPGDKPALPDSLAPLYASYVVWGGAWLLAQETFLWFSWNKWPSSLTWQAGALYAVSSLGALYAAAAFAIGAKKRDIALRLSALGVGALAMALPLWTGMAFATGGWTPFWNLRALAYFIIALALAAIAWMLSRDEDGFDGSEAETINGTTQWWPSAVSVFALVGVTIEIYCGFGRGATPANGEWRAGAFFAIAMVWSVFAALMVQLSANWRQDALRLSSLAVAAMASLLLLIAAVGYSDLDWTPFFNLRATAFAVTVALLGRIAAIEHRRFRQSGVAAATSAPIALLCCGLLLWGLTQESYAAFGHFHGALGGHWKLIACFFISLLWNGGAFALLQVGLRRDLLSFRIAAYNLAALASALLLWTAVDAVKIGWLPFLNARCGAFVLAAVLLATGSALRGKRQKQLSDWERQCLGIMGWLAGALLLWGITQEVYESCFYFRQALGGYWVRWAQMVISLAWSVYGALLLIGGINRNYQPLRLAALGLLAVTILKVFVFDLGFLSGPLRMFSLAGLGVSLIFISWLYGRYARDGGNDDVERE